MPHSDSSRFWLAAEAMLAVALVALPWLFGGTTWARGLLLATGSGALLSWSIGARKNRRRWAWHLLFWLPLVTLAVGLLQLIPLPQFLLRLLSPVGAELREFALVPLGLDRLRPLSMDPPATARALTRLVGLTGLLVTAFQLGRLPAVRRRLFRVLALSGVSIAICGYVHLLASEPALFGAHQFVNTIVPFVTPFWNTNHLAAYLSLTGTVALSLALEAENRDNAIGWGLAAFACGVGVFLSYSRGGIATFVATWGLVGSAFFSRKAGGLRTVLPWVVIIATVGFAALLSFEELLERVDSLSSLEKLGETKVYLWPMFASGAAAFWPAGMGIGAFELGFSRFQNRELSVTYTHPENFVLQWMSEAGLPLSVALLVLAAVALWRVWVAVRMHTPERYMALALVGVALHELFDFAFEFEALGASVTILAGLLAATSEAETRAHLPRSGLWRAAGLTALGVGALIYGTPTHLAAERALGEAVRLRRGPARIESLALQLIDRHPSDWVLYANVAQDVAREGKPLEALAWTNRVLFLRPDDARIHIAAAQALLRLGKSRQALGELKLAWGLGDLSSLELGLAIAEKDAAWDRVLLDRPGHLTAAFVLLRQRGKNEQAMSLLRAASDFPPSDAVGREAQGLVARAEAELGDPERALGLLEALPADERATVELQLVRTQVLFKLNHTDQAIAELERLQGREPNRLDVGLELAARLSSVGRGLAAIEALERLEPFVTGTAARSALFQREAAVWQQQERWGRAIEALQTAARLEPTRADLHYHLAEVFEHMGSTSAALDEVRRGRLLDTPEGAKARNAWMERLSATPVGDSR